MKTQFIFRQKLISLSFAYISSYFLPSTHHDIHNCIEKYKLQGLVEHKRDVNNIFLMKGKSNVSRDKK